MSVSININKTLGVEAGTSIIAPTNSFTNTHSTDYDGVDDYVNCGNASNLNFTKVDAFSFSLWFKRDVNNIFHILLSKMNPSGNRRGYFVGINPSNVITVMLRTDTSFTSQNLTYKSTNTITDTNWHHIVFTYDGGVAQSSGKIYIDAAAETVVATGGGAITSIQSSSTTPFLISGINTTPILPANGNLDEIAVFDSELSASDVTNIYNGGGSGKPGDLTSLSPVSWWRFEEGSGTTANDLGTGGNNGTLINGTAYSTDVP